MNRFNTKPTKQGFRLADLAVLNSSSWILFEKRKVFACYNML